MENQKESLIFEFFSCLFLIIAITFTLYTIDKNAQIQKNINGIQKELNELNTYLRQSQQKHFSFKEQFIKEKEEACIKKEKEINVSEEEIFETPYDDIQKLIDDQIIESENK